jgi:uncharacterized protein YcfJ
MVEAMDAPARKAQLETWIVASQRNRLRIVTGSAVGAVVGFLVAFIIHGPIGAAIVVGSVAIAMCGGWITTAHILTFRGQIKDLAAGRLDPQTIHVRQGRGRYQR